MAFTASGPLKPLSLRFDRQRLWYEFLRAGFGAADLKQVVGYLQTEIRAQRRNVGALKLSNLLQLDRFEEDLHISRVRLKPPVQRPEPAPPPPPRRRSTRGDAPDCSRSSEAFVSNSVAARLRKPRRGPSRHQSGLSPRNNLTKHPRFSPNILTPTPRNNVARYTIYTVE